MRKDFLSRLLRFLVWAAAIITMSLLILLVGYILINGIPHLKASLFDLNYTSDNVSMLPSIINTVLMTIISLLIAAPIGICSAIYLVEYAKRGNKLVEVVRITAETLSGSPSIVYGLFGAIFFVTVLGWGLSLLSGAFTMAIMIHPLIMRTTEEALKSVPDSYRDGSFGLGAGRVRTIFRIVLPGAAPGILAGVLLSIGRILGESAALIYTAGSGTGNLSFREGITAPLFQSARTLSVHMYCLMIEGLHLPQAHATAVVLLILVLGLNALSGLAARKLITQ